MKIFSYWTHGPAPVPHRIDNAAPVTPAVNPFAVQFQAAARPAVNPFRLPERDQFTRFGQTVTSHKPVVPSFNEAYQWLNEHNASELNARLEMHLALGTHEDLRQAVGLLNAAYKGQKLSFAEDSARKEFANNYRQAVEALMGDDPTAKMLIQRALRSIDGYQNMGSVTDKAVATRSPFKL